MVSDREFLDGIYKKAEKLVNEQNTSFHSKKETKLGFWNRYKRWTPVFAVCIGIVIGIPIYMNLNPIKNEEIYNNQTRTTRISESQSAPIAADQQPVYAPVECEVVGEITAVVQDEAGTYLLMNITEIIEGFVPETILIKCDKGILEGKEWNPAIGQKGKLRIEEQPTNEFKEEYNNRIASDSNIDSKEKIEEAIKNNEAGNGFIGYFNLKSIGEYYGI